MNDNKRNGSNTAKYKYLLSGLIECGQCGGAYVGRTSKNSQGYSSRYYVCNNKYRNRTCKVKNINADEIELAVAAKIREYFSGNDFDLMADEIYKAYNDGKSSQEAEKKELATLEREISNLVQAIKKGLDCEEVRDELARLNVRKAELNEIISAPPGFVLSKGIIADKLRVDAQHLKNGDIERLVKSYITKIYAHDDEIIITGGVDLGYSGKGT